MGNPSTVGPWTDRLTIYAQKLGTRKFFTLHGKDSLKQGRELQVSENFEWDEIAFYRTSNNIKCLVKNKKGNLIIYTNFGVNVIDNERIQ